MKHFIVGSLLILSACHKDETPVGPTAQQSDQLNATEDMLNGMGQNEEGPADHSAGPSTNSAN